MKYRDNIAAIEELALSEGGVFTTAQAARLGIPRDSLSYASRTGHVERIAQGAYRLAASEDDGLDELRAIWKLTASGVFSHERVAVSRWDGIAVFGPTAASILDVGDFFPSPYYLATPRRINTRRHDVHFVRTKVAREDVIWRLGMPVLRPEAAVASLVQGLEDPSLVSNAFVDAVRRYGATTFDIRKLVALLGNEEFERMTESAGIYPGGPRELIALDSLGHVAIVEGMSP